MVKDITDKISKDAKKKMEEMMKKKNRTKEEEDNLDLAKTHYKTLTKNFKKQNSKSAMKKKEKEMMSLCEKAFCNPDCKDTIFDESTQELPKFMTQKYKKNPALLKMLKGLKTDLFKDKKTILKDGFYEGLKSKTVKKMKSEGAISGCAKMLLV